MDSSIFGPLNLRAPTSIQFKFNRPYQYYLGGSEYSLVSGVEEIWLIISVKLICDNVTIRPGVKDTAVSNFMCVSSHYNYYIWCGGNAIT